MKLVKSDVKYLFLILLTSLLTVTDLFINIGRSSNGDGLIHTVAPTLFANALLQGNFPVGWVDGFANYGMPLGTISQQLTTYLTAFLTIIFHDPTIGFNIVIFLGVLLSSIFFYSFLRIYFLPIYSFTGVFLLNFAPYRILNIYIRGALPEFFAGVFFPLILIAIYLVICKKNVNGLFLLIISVFLLTLTHPFMLIVLTFLLIPYVLFLLFTTYKTSFKNIILNFLKYGVLFLGTIIFGILMGSYYILPLVLENKFFYYGHWTNYLTPNNFLGFSNFFFYNYPYFYNLDISGRGFFINVGLIETFFIITGLILLITSLIKFRSFHTFSILDFSVIAALIFIFMMMGYSDFIYLHISFLSKIQFPWRMLSGFIFLPPIILAYILSKLKNKLLVIICLVIISLVAFPQLYGKNYTQYPYSFYTFSSHNLNAVIMNTVWTGRSEDYPIKLQKWDIIEGKGTILSSKVNNSSRTYQVLAQTPIRMVDYTFYFPGWKVFIDNNPVAIEFQNPNYRGVITYLVPAGKHNVVLKYTDTKIRLLGKIGTIFFTSIFIILFILRRKLSVVWLKTINSS